MGNQTSQTSLQQLKQLKNYEQVSRINEGVIYRQSQQSQNPQYFILKEHNFHSTESYEAAYKKYKQALISNTEQQSNTLAIKEVLKEQVQHFCSNTYKIFVLYEYPQLTLRDQIEVRAKESKFFEECEIVAILQTCVLALEQIRASICFDTKAIFISPDGVIKVLHNDLIDENYRHVITAQVYYAPEKLTNFLSQSTSELALKKQIIFSMGMALLQACCLSSLYDIYDYSKQKIDQTLLQDKIQSLASRYSSELIELLANMLQINPNRRISMLEVQRALNRFDELESERLNEEEIVSHDKNQLEQKCDKLFNQYQGNGLPRIKQSIQSNEEPSVPNLISNQNSSRMSIGKSHNSRANTTEEFYHQLNKSIQNYKTLTTEPNPMPSYQNNMTAHFTPLPKPDTQNLFTDPKLLQMIRKDLEQINKSRTSRMIVTSDPVNSSVYQVRNSQVAKQEEETNRQYAGYRMTKPSQMSSNVSNSYENQYMNFSHNQGPYTVLDNCPQVQSLAASVAVDNSHKTNFVYQQSEVKCHPQQNLKASIALSTKNFNSTGSNNDAIQQQTPNTNESKCATVRYPLRQVSTNLNPASSLSEVEDQIKKEMMKKKEANLIYLEEQYEDGIKYEGMSKNGLKEGYGKLIYSDGAYYQGYFHNDKINGKGILFYSKDHPAYDGEWLDEQFNGYGELYNQDPEELHEEFPYHNWNFLENYWVKYEGEFSQDNKHGKGRIYLTSDEYVEGEFRDDMLNGWAKFYKQNGDYIEGRWENNVLVELRNQ